MSETEATKIWTKACSHLEDALPKDLYSRWIAVIKPWKLEANALTLNVDNDFYQTWLEDNYLTLIHDALAAACGKPLEVKFIVGHAAIDSALPPGPEPVKRKTIRQRLTKKSKLQTALNPKYTFDSFVVGTANQFAHAAALAVAQAPARAYNPLFIYGGVGLGKTHLMEAIGQHVISTTNNASVWYTSSEAFINEYIEDLKRNQLVQFRKKYRKVDLLLIDDIHFLAGKKALQEEFFHTFNALFDAHKQIVLTSDRPAGQIAGLEERLVSRFEWGLVTELQAPDLETRAAILRQKRDEGGMNVSDDVLQYIAENVRSHVRQLEGALVRVVSYNSLTGRELTHDVMVNLLEDITAKEERAIVTCETIQKVVAEYYDVRLADMTSTKRQQSVAHPRQVAMYLCRKLTTSSLPDIARVFSKTHATILHAYRSIDKKTTSDEELKHSVSDIARKLGRKL